MVDKPARHRLFYRISRFREATERDIRRALAMYYAQIAFADDCVGRVLETLDQTGLRDRTVVAFTSDHGDYSGEHRMMTKSGALYDCLTRVPLIVSYPGHLPEGAVREELVSTMDLVPTMLALAGVPAPPALTPDVFQARALPGTGVGTGDPREAVFAEYAAGGPPLPETLPEPDPDSVPPVGGGPSQVGRPRQALPVLRAREGEGRPKMVRTHRWKYVYDSDDPVDELYDLERDPWELENLAARPEHAQVVNEMRRRLLDWSLRTEDPRPVPQLYDLTTFEPTAEPAYWPPASRSVPTG
jgi:arylsulfatase A-like enzyme